MMTEKPEDKSEFIKMLQAVPELDMESALAVVDGSADAFEHIFRLTIRLLPENIERLNACMDAELPNYAIEVHGLKSVLNNIGAFVLGKMAFELETAAKRGDADACNALHPALIESVERFYAAMARLIDDPDDSDKPQGELRMIEDALPELEEKVDLFNSVGALKILSSISQYAYNEAIDSVLAELTAAFESFDFDKAAALLDRLKEEINVTCERKGHNG